MLRCVCAVLAAPDGEMRQRGARVVVQLTRGRCSSWTHLNTCRGCHLVVCRRLAVWGVCCFVSRFMCLCGACRGAVLVVNHEGAQLIFLVNSGRL